MQTFRLARPAPLRTVVTGLAAGGAYLLAQAMDRRLSGNGYDDLMLWGGFVTPHPTRQRFVGLTVHGALSITLAAAYAALQPSLPRWPRWLRGMAFVQAENALLYPGVPLINAVHPSVRSGALPSLLTWRYGGVEVARHAAYGMVLGLLTPEDRT